MQTRTWLGDATTAGRPRRASSVAAAMAASGLRRFLPLHGHATLYRPGRSAKQAVAVTRERCWRYDWVVEFDIKAAFDQIDHE